MTDMWSNPLFWLTVYRHKRGWVTGHCAQGWEWQSGEHSKILIQHLSWPLPRALVVKRESDKPVCTYVQCHVCRDSAVDWKIQEGSNAARQRHVSGQPSKIVCPESACNAYFGCRNKCWLPSRVGKEKPRSQLMLVMVRPSSCGSCSEGKARTSNSCQIGKWITMHVYSIRPFVAGNGPSDVLRFQESLTQRKGRAQVRGGWVPPPGSRGEESTTTTRTWFGQIINLQLNRLLSAWTVLEPQM